MHVSHVRVEFINGLGNSCNARHRIPAGVDFFKTPDAGSTEPGMVLDRAQFSPEDAFDHIGAFWVVFKEGRVWLSQALFPDSDFFWVVDIQDKQVVSANCVTLPIEVPLGDEGLTLIATKFDCIDSRNNDQLTALFRQHGATRFIIDDSCHSTGRPPTPPTPGREECHEEGRDQSPEGPTRKRPRERKKRVALPKKKAAKAPVIRHERRGVEVVDDLGDDGKSVSSGDLPPANSTRPRPVRMRRRNLTGRQQAGRVEVGPDDDPRDIQIKQLQSRLRFELGLKIKYYHLYRNTRYQLRQIEMKRAENVRHITGKALADKALELLRTQGTLLARMQDQIALERKYVNATQADSAASMLRTLVSPAVPAVEADAEVRQFRARWNDIGKKMCEGRPGVKRFKEFIQRYISEIPLEEMSETRKELAQAVEHLCVDDDLHLYTFYLEWNQLANSIFHDVVTDPNEATILDVERTRVRETLLRAKIHPRWLLTAAEYMQYMHGQLVLKHAPPPPGQQDGAAGPSEAVPRGGNPFRMLGQLDYRSATVELVASHLESQLEEFEGEGKEDMERLPKVYNMNIRYPIGGQITEDALDDIAMGIFGKFAVLCKDGAAMIPSLEADDLPVESPPNDDDPDTVDRTTPLDQVARMAVLSVKAAAAPAPSPA